MKLEHTLQNDKIGIFCPIGAELTPPLNIIVFTDPFEPPTYFVILAFWDAFLISISNINPSQKHPKTHILRWNYWRGTYPPVLIVSIKFILQTRLNPPIINTNIATFEGFHLSNLLYWNWSKPFKTIKLVYFALLARNFTPRFNSFY